MDLVVHPDVAGGLSNAATVIAQIGDLDVPALAQLASVRSRSLARRLGWLLDRFRDDLDPEPLRAHAEELLATKLRALYQRSKGRDLFDVWLGLTILEADPEQITAGLHHYMRDAAFSFPELRDNLTAKLANHSFLHDLDTLLASTPPAYKPRQAADILMRELGAKLRNGATRRGDRSAGFAIRQPPPDSGIPSPQTSKGRSSSAEASSSGTALGIRSRACALAVTSR